MNEQQIDPMPVIIGKAKYPENIISKLNVKIKNVTSVNALKIANECGNTKAVNIVLAGMMAKGTGIPKDLWLDTIRGLSRGELLEVNIKAFEFGYAG